MKGNKKKVFVTALCVCLIAILSFGTLAWFTSEDSVTNTFKFASSDGQKTDFSVDVYEKGKVYTEDENGDITTDEVIVDKDDDGDTIGLIYDNVLPGDVLPKTVSVANTSSIGASISGTDYSQFIRVHIAINDPEEVIYNRYKNVYGSNFVKLAINDMLQLEDGTLLSNVDMWNMDVARYCKEDDRFEITLYLKQAYGPLKPDAELTVFDNFVIPTILTVEDANTLTENGGISVEITAEAIQSDNLVNAEGEKITKPVAAFNQLICTADAYWEEN